MLIVRQIDDLPAELRGGAVTIGNFDGVHRGHARLVERLRMRAQDVGGPAIVFTFDPHPVRLLRPEQCPPPLTWTERKAELLARLGVDGVVAYPTSRALLGLSARQFFDQIVVEKLAAKAMVEGPNFYFGRSREGNVSLLGEFTAAAGMTLDVVASAEEQGQMISSSRIRNLIGDQGDVAAAGAMLTAPYRLRGIVTHGAGRGATIGFPTANLEGIDTLLPAHGVYAGVGWRGDKSWPAAINIGPNPTFGESTAKLEAHLIGCNESLYGQPMELDFLDRLRDVRRFDTTVELTDQVSQDIASAQRIAAQLAPPPPFREGR
ncbi:bifunctional riboflavin kinase/FAD synthetase [Botrimarina hoheduenensis]|uniref:Riboflavin biosynthesis protein n=1 Tax=Botrimarina hoheduenensis TaxID=2528000 RepID=A0A5C5VZD6_9BACT|nr:bifunctional riboflavin kinase/FAD synthetase [Botrimarina hoheduenensis]TWT43365.1 Riboflavin kinase [Botrimarina hoheduenensis]